MASIEASTSSEESSELHLSIQSSATVTNGSNCCELGKRKLLSCELSEEGSKKSRSDGFQLRGYYSYRKGEREEMQDEHIILDDFSEYFSLPDVKVSFYAIYDGHNGSRAAKYAAENLHKNLAAKLPRGSDQKKIEQSLKRAFIESYKQTDDGFLSEAAKVKPVLKDGSTAATILALDHTLFVANIGDSRAVLCRYKPEENKEIALTLTKDHSPQVFEERMRIEKAGGSVKDGRILGILEVSRSIGDGQYKKHGVTCVPDVKRCSLTENDRYLLIGCDGLWKTFSNQEVLNFVEDSLKKVRSNDDIVATEEKTLEQVQWETVCSQLAGEAVRRGSGDNVTVVVVVISN